MRRRPRLSSSFRSASLVSFHVGMYFAYAYGLTADGTATTAVFRQTFTTPTEQHKPSDCTFRIEIPEMRIVYK